MPLALPGREPRGVLSNQDEAQWVSFDDVLETAADQLNDLEEILSTIRDVPKGQVSLRKRLKGRARRQWDSDEAVVDRLIRRAIPHTYSGRFEEGSDPLVRDGILDVRLADEVELTDGERAVVGVLAREGTTSA